MSNNRPAFPRSGDADTGTSPQNGMSLRDYFAGQALIACILHQQAAQLNEKTIADCAYSYADAMLEAR